MAAQGRDDMKSAAAMKLGRRRCCVLAGVATAACLAPVAAASDDGPARAADTVPPLTFGVTQQEESAAAPVGTTAAGSRLTIEPMAWFPALNGNLEFDPGRSFDINAIGIAEVHAAPALQFTYRVGDWSVQGDGFGFWLDDTVNARRPVSIRGEAIAAGTAVSTDIAYGAFTLTGGRRVWQLPLRYEGRPADPTLYNVPPHGSYVGIDVYAGARLWALDLNVSADGFGELVDETSVWVDPIVGGRVLLDLPRGFGVDVQSDIGGFGVGSEFAWNIEVGLHYEMTDTLSAEIGFRHLQTFYNDDGYDWDITAAGLFGSIVFRY